MRASRIFGDKCNAFDTTNALESTPTGADCANLLRSVTSHGARRIVRHGSATVAAEIGPVVGMRSDWDNLRAGRVGSGHPFA